MSLDCLYWRVDPGVKAWRGSAMEHLVAVAHKRESPTHTILYCEYNTKYYVVSVADWSLVYTRSVMPAQEALYHAVEAFDTLEQATLYFEMVKG
jgi:hypothetical protein